MKKYFIAIMLLMCIPALGRTVEDEIKVIKTYVIKMNKRVKQLEAKVEKLEQLIKKTNQNQDNNQIPIENDPFVQNDVVAEDIPDPIQPGKTPPVAPFFSESANKASLLRIKPPRRWSKRAVQSYLKKISLASQGQNVCSSTDYQVYLINQIPMEYLEVILQTFLSEGRFSTKFYINLSIPPRIRQQDKAIVLKYLLQYEQLVKAIAPRPTWHAEAWPILVRRLSDNTELGANSVPDVWINLVASKDKDQANKALLIYFETHPSLHVLNAIQSTSTEKKDIKTSVLKSWTKNRHHSWHGTRAANCAVSYGEKSALKQLINLIKNVGPEQWKKRSAKSLLNSLTVIEDLELVKWYEKYEKVIVFDENQMKFIVPDKDK